MARARARHYVSFCQSSTLRVIAEWGKKADVLVNYPDAVGPFHTKRAAAYYLQHPTCGGVAAAERACKTLDAPTVSDTIPSLVPDAATVSETV